MKNLTWEGNEWQGLLFVYACFLMLLGWLAKLRSRFHPKKFLIKCWCACLRLLLRSAWNDFWSQVSAVIQLVQMPPHGCTDVPYTPLHSQQLPPCRARVTKPRAKGRSNLNLSQTKDCIWMTKVREIEEEEYDKQDIVDCPAARLSALCAETTCRKTET